MGTLLRTQGGTFNIAEAVEIPGPVDPTLFRAALVQVAQEAETTRVSIRMGGMAPIRSFCPHCVAPCRLWISPPGQMPQCRHNTG